MGRCIYVVTHPEATHHVAGVVGGWHDSDLTAQGRRHAEVILACSAEHIVIVTHGIALTYVVTARFEVPWTHVGYVSFAPGPGSITTLVEDDYFHNRQVATLADISHLVE